MSGTDANPTFTELPNFSIKNDTLNSRFIGALPVIDGNNQLGELNLRNGYHPVANSIGFETRFTLADWSVTERLRYSDMRAIGNLVTPIQTLPAAIVGTAFAGPGGTLQYVTGPRAGQTITDPAGLNGNGLLELSLVNNYNVRSLNNVTNDFRASRVWNVGGGALTTTFGLYKSEQDLDYDLSLTTYVQDVVGDGRSALIDVRTAGGYPITQDGVLTFGVQGGGFHRSYAMQYDVTAPYGSFNFHKGRVAVGGSLRYDLGNVEGTIRQDQVGDVRPLDVNGDGIFSFAELATNFTPISRNQPVDYNYKYLSYSGGVNFRISDPFAIFARYSRGARAGADRLLFSSAISPTDGSLVNKKAGYDPVRQAEVGLKYRKDGLTLNVTGFWAKANETNTQLNPGPTGTLQLELISRVYQAYGAEFEGAIRRGPFSLTAGATLTDAEIKAADGHPELVGKTPRHQAAVIFQATPQFETDLFTIGANFIGTTGSYAQDSNQLRLPGYTTVGAFVQIRPIDRVVVALSASNLFDKLAMTDTGAGTLAGTNGTVLAQSLYGRTISSSVRIFF